MMIEDDGSEDGEGSKAVGGSLSIFRNLKILRVLRTLRTLRINRLLRSLTYLFYILDVISKGGQTLFLYDLY